MALVLVNQHGCKELSWADGFSPVHWAAQADRRDIIEYLLQKDGGEELLFVRDKKGRTPVQYAQGQGHSDMAAWLQEVGDDVLRREQLAQPSAAGSRPQSAKSGRSTNSRAGAGAGLIGLAVAARKEQQILNSQAQPHTQASPQGSPQRREIPSPQKNPMSAMMSPQQRDTNLEPAQVADQSFNHSRAHSSPMVQASSLAQECRLGVPKVYLGVLQAVERDGWDVMHWQSNYTLLHWAAKKNHIKLVKYIVA